MGVNHPSIFPNASLLAVYALAKIGILGDSPVGVGPAPPLVSIRAAVRAVKGCALELRRCKWVLHSSAYENLISDKKISAFLARMVSTRGCGARKNRSQSGRHSEKSKKDQSS